MPLYAELQIDKERIIYPVPVPQGKEHYKIVRLLSGSTLYDRKYPRQPLYLFNGEMLWANEMSKEPEIQTTEIIARPGDSEAKEQAESTMNQLIEAMKKSLLDAAETMPEEKRRVVLNALAVADVATKSAEIIKEHAENPDGNLFDKIGKVAEYAGLIKPHNQFKSGGIRTPIVDESEYVIRKPLAFSGGFIHIPPKQTIEPDKDAAVTDTYDFDIPTVSEPEKIDPEMCLHKRTDYFIGTGIKCLDCKKTLRK